MDPLERILPEYRELIHRLGRSQTRMTFFLHVAKTGGNSLTQAFQNGTNTVTAWLPDFGKSASEPCSCTATASCRLHRDIRILENLSEQSEDELHILLCTTDHTIFRHAEHFVEMLSAAQQPEILVSVRPVRDRVVSAFRDYWTQVSRAKSIIAQAGPEQDNPEFAVIQRENLARLEGYLRDSRHYVDESGNIDGIGWFRSFQKYGGGIPFFLDDIFEGNFPGFTKLVHSKRLNVVPIHKLDSHIYTLTGNTPVRHRSSIPSSPALDIALADSTNLIDEIAERDALYDTFLATYLNDRSFRMPVTSRLVMGTQ